MIEQRFCIDTLKLLAALSGDELSRRVNSELREAGIPITRDRHGFIDGVESGELKTYTDQKTNQRVFQWLTDQEVAERARNEKR